MRSRRPVRLPFQWEALQYHVTWTLGNMLFSVTDCENKHGCLDAFWWIPKWMMTGASDWVSVEHLDYKNIKQQPGLWGNSGVSFIAKGASSGEANKEGSGKEDRSWKHNKLDYFQAGCQRCALRTVCVQFPPPRWRNRKEGSNRDNCTVSTLRTVGVIPPTAR